MKIAVYVQHNFSKGNYAKESFAVRLFAGIESIRKVIINNGHDVSYCDMYTVCNYDVILVSITSGCDWWSYISERARWAKGTYKVIIGGAGVMNVRPFLSYFDFAVLGRGEKIILDLIKNLDAYDHESVINVRSFSSSKKYKIAQATELLPELMIGFGSSKEQRWVETGIGCKRKCLFCAYTYHRKYLNTARPGESYQNDGLNSEYTMADLDMSNDDWTKDNIRSIGLDGCSRR